jgi:hypothetical protein
LTFPHPDGIAATIKIIDYLILCFWIEKIAGE